MVAAIATTDGILIRDRETFLQVITSFDGIKNR